MAECSWSVVDLMVLFAGATAVIHTCREFAVFKLDMRCDMYLPAVTLLMDVLSCQPMIPDTQNGVQATLRQSAAACARLGRIGQDQVPFKLHFSQRLSMGCIKFFVPAC
jgi:hypothetical protein